MSIDELEEVKSVKMNSSELNKVRHTETEYDEEINDAFGDNEPY